MIFLKKYAKVNIRYIQKGIFLNIPSHCVPSPRGSVKPGLQVQPNPPSELEHTASLLQLSEPLSHSSMSKKKFQNDNNGTVPITMSQNKEFIILVAFK